MVSRTGIRLIQLALCVIFVTGLNKVFFHFGLSISQRLISMVGSLICFSLFAVGAWKYCRVRKVWQMAIFGHRVRVKLWISTVIIFAVVGVFSGNEIAVIGKETIILLLMGFGLILGCDDLIWSKLEKPLIIMFYIALTLVIWGRDIGAVTTSIYETEKITLTYVSNRFLNTLAYNLKPLLGAGMYLGASGLVGQRTTIWRILKILAIPAYFFAYIVIFKFRGALASLGLLLMMFFFVRPMFEGKIRLNLSFLLIYCCLLGVLFFFTTEAFSILMYRIFEVTKQEALFDSRLIEFNVFLKDMGWDILIGRGLGGTFSAGGLISYVVDEWGTLHFGVMVFLLKGGVWMFLLFISLFSSCLKKKPIWWYRNPYNMAATLMLPILMIQFFLNPFALVPGSIFMYLTSMFCLARFSREEILDLPNPNGEIK